MQGYAVFRHLARLPFAVSLVFVFSSHCLAQPIQPLPNHPKIGLVLEGGGALGFAHVGVMKVLEEEHVPVHLIAGTSMGSIVGAAYASGRSAAEMEKAMSEADWDALFYEAPARQYVRYREKIGRDRELVQDGKIGYVDGQIKVPLAFVEGQRIEPLFQRLFSKVPPSVSFDDLPVPFRAVAADIETGEMVILDHGNLARSARASMSVPGFFSPVEIDGRLLVDGGVSNNFPVDIAKQMGAEVIIGIELPDNFRTRKELTSPISISGQILDMLLAETTRRRKGLLGPDDILIQPDIKKYSAGSFGDAAAIMAAGEAAARAAVDKIRRYAIPEKDYEEYNRKRCGMEEIRPKLDYITVKASSPERVEEVTQAIEIKPGETLDQDSLTKNIDELFLGGEYRKISYDLEQKDGKNGLVVTAEDKEWLKQYFRFGFSIEDDFEGDSSYTLAARFRAKDLNTLGAEGQIDAEVGRSPYVRGEFYQPLWAASPFFIAPAAEFGRQELLLRRGGDLIAEYERKNFSGALRTGLTVARYGELSTGYRRGEGQLDRRIGDEALPQIDYDIGEWVSTFNFDQLDSPDFPKSGFRFLALNTLSRDGLGGGGDFELSRGLVSVPIAIGETTVLLNFESGVSSEDLPAERLFAFGGFTDISGFVPGSLSASDYVIGRTAIYHRFAESGPKFFGLGGYFGVTMEYASLRSSVESIPDEPSILAGSVFLAFDTPVMPPISATAFRMNPSSRFILFWDDCRQNGGRVRQFKLAQIGG